MTVCRTLTSDFTNVEHLTSFFKFRFLLLWTAHVANCVQRELLEDEYSSERKRKKFGKFVTETVFLEMKACPKRADLYWFHFVLCSCVPQTRKSQQGNVPSPVHMRINTEFECERVNFVCLCLCQRFSDLNFLCIYVSCMYVGMHAYLNMSFKLFCIYRLESMILAQGNTIDEGVSSGKVSAKDRAYRYKVM